MRIFFWSSPSKNKMSRILRSAGLKDVTNLPISRKATEREKTVSVDVLPPFSSSVMEENLCDEAQVFKQSKKVTRTPPRPPITVQTKLFNELELSPSHKPVSRSPSPASSGTNVVGGGLSASQVSGEVQSFLERLGEVCENGSPNDSSCSEAVTSCNNLGRVSGSSEVAKGPVNFAPSSGKSGCPIRLCKSEVADASLIAHINKVHLLKSPEAVFLLEDFMIDRDLWFCSQCSKVSKGNHTVGSGCHRRPDHISSSSMLKDRLVVVGEVPLPCDSSVQAPQPPPAPSSEGSDSGVDTSFRPFFENENIFLEIRKAKITTINYIPNQLVNRVRRNFEEILDNVNKEPGNLDRHAELHLFAKCVLRVCPPQEDGSKHLAPSSQKKYSKSLLDKWEAGAEGRRELVADVIKPARPRLKRKDSKGSQKLLNHRRCIGLTAIGRFSDAMQSLLSNGVSEVKGDVLDTLKAKHPERLDVHNPRPPPPEPMTVGEEVVTKTVSNFKKGSACGSDGLRSDHIQAFIKGDSVASQKFKTTLTSHVNLLLSGRFPPMLAPFIAGAPVTALTKPDGGIRPIAVGEFLRRLTSKVVVASVKNVVIPYLNPHQVGVASKCGIETALFQFERVVREKGLDSGFCSILFDFENAFNLCDRQKMFDIVREKIPGAAAWVEFCYESEALLFAGDHILKSSVGVQQGDPLGPLLFSLLLHTLVLEIKAEFPDLDLNIWYLDDGTCVGRVETIAKVFAKVRDRGVAYGLRLNTKKTQIWWPTLDLTKLEQLFPPEVERVNDPGIKLLGSMIGESSFINAFVLKKVQKIAAQVEALGELEDAQVQLLLLRSCVGLPKFAHLLRVCHPRVIDDATNRFDKMIDGALELIVNNGATAELRSEMALPISRGGFGIPRAKDVAFPAYINARSEFLRKFPDDDEKLFIEGLIDEWNGVAVKEKYQVSAQVLLASNNPQKLMTAALFDNIAEDLYNSAPAATRCRLDSNRLSPAEWLRVEPTFGLRMEPAAFRVAIRQRLGMDVRAKSENCTFCKRGFADYRGIHDTRCSTVVKLIHDSFRDKMFKMMADGAMAVEKEKVDVLKDESDDRPADIYLRDGSHGRGICYDLSVVDYTTPDGIADREKLKMNKYAARCDNVGVIFRPLVVNSLGQFSSEFKEFCGRIGRARADKFGTQAPSEISKVSRNAQFYLIKIISDAVLGRLRELGGGRVCG
jgi:hypothetical protein